MSIGLEKIQISELLKQYFNDIQEKDNLKSLLEENERQRAYNERLYASIKNLNSSFIKEMEQESELVQNTIVYHLRKIININETIKQIDDKYEKLELFINSLSAEENRLLEYKYSLGLSFREMGNKLNLSHVAIKKKNDKIISYLTKKLTENIEC
jgi:DNA-directed RNA polymerase specialized sigma24 family protein